MWHINMGENFKWEETLLTSKLFVFSTGIKERRVKSTIRIWRIKSKAEISRKYKVTKGNKLLVVRMNVSLFEVFCHSQQYFTCVKILPKNTCTQLETNTELIPCSKLVASLLVAPQTEILDSPPISFFFQPWWIGVLVELALFIYIP